MTALNVLVFIAGVAVVALTLGSASRTLLVPRAIPAKLGRIVFIAVRWVFRIRAGARHSYERRDRTMAFYAPVALLTLLSVWLTLVLLAYAAMFWGLGVRPLASVIVDSGSSLFTLGFAHLDTFAKQILAFSEAGLGLILLALLITYLPSLYAAFSRREQGVAKLEVRAGNPPTGPYLIALAHTVTGLKRLQGFWNDWEDWFVQLDESHTSFPALTFFRSPHPNQSWITAAGAVLDGASLYASSVDIPRTPDPEYMIRAGYLALRHIADFFGIPHDPNPEPTDAISISREEYDAAYDEMAAAGVPMKPDRDQAWRDFAGWRVNYDTVLLALARLTDPPPAPWSSDRVEPGNFTPPVFRRRVRG
ncbi:MAG: hypothetical protein ACXVP7_07065 [Actinomycetota bacterium]